MAGHSKWANIRFRKAGQDAKRGKIFTKFIREITVAARLQGADVQTNPRLRDVVNKALSQNMSRDTIDRAIKRGIGDQDSVSMMDVRYEGYGPAGVAIMVECLTDNRNRTVAEVRHALTKYNGNLGNEGSVGYLFRKVGLLNFVAGYDEGKIMEAALDAGADDIVLHPDGSVEVITTPENLEQVQQGMKQAGFTANQAETTQLASTQVTLDKETAETLIKLTDMLEDLDDVQNVYSNANIPDEVLKSLS